MVYRCAVSRKKSELFLILMLMCSLVLGSGAVVADSPADPASVAADTAVEASPAEAATALEENEDQGDSEALEPRPVLRVGVEDGWPPYADAQGRGLSTDIVTAAFAVAGLEVAIETKPYARVLRELESGQLDAGYNVVPQTSTEQRFIFGSVPVLTATVSFYYAPGAVKPYRSVADIPTGTTIASIIDYEYGDQFEAQRSRFREYKVMRQSQIIRMLMAGRVDMAVMYDRVVEYTLNRMDLPADTLVRGALNHTSDVYVAFSRKNPRSAEYAELLDQGLLEIRRNGVYDQILNRSRPR